jgi:IS30 family transposase
MESKNYTRLNKEDRIKIQTLLKIGMTVTQIAKELERSPSTISREVKKGIHLPGEGYFAEQAERRSFIYRRTRRPDTKLSVNDKLRNYVIRQIKVGWSPEQISFRLRLKYPGDSSMLISYESIYKYIYYEAKGEERRKLISHLPYKKPKRSGGKRNQIYMGKIPDRITIDERPEEVGMRLKIGHWEGDLIVGKGQLSVIGTLVERATRFTIIVKLESRKSEHVIERFAEELKKYPSQILKTLTYDNGVEMTAHKEFTRRTQMAVYFAHPYSSWERGTNENTNGLIRRIFPKKTDFSKITEEELKELELLLNTRPRKVLGWRTPFEQLIKLCA